MKYKVGDLVRVCWRGSFLDDETPPIHGTAGMVISRRWCGPFADPVYGVYLANLQCREILEADLEKL